MKKENIYFIAFVLLLFIATSTISIQRLFLNENKKKVFNHKIIAKQKDDFSVSSLYKELKKYRVKFIDVAIAQFYIETGYKSGICSDILCVGNNLFAMKYAIVRPSAADTIFTVTGGGRYAMYKDWRRSVLDYAFYQAHYIKASMNKKDWINFIQKKYSSDKNYSKKILNIINAKKFKNEFFNHFD